jgi:hypothetical protein
MKKHHKSGTLIILEGMDGTGKTTLAKTIQSNLPNFQYTHPVPSEGPAGQTEEYMVTGMLDLFKQVREGADIITDRINLISEEIYGPICRGKSTLRLGNYLRVKDELFNLIPKPIIIFCRPELPVVLQNLEAENVLQMDGVKENHTALYKAYDRWFGDWLRKGIVCSNWFYIYDYTKDLKAELFMDFLEGKMGYELAG